MAYKGRGAHSSVVVRKLELGNGPVPPSPGF